MPEPRVALVTRRGALADSVKVAFSFAGLGYVEVTSVDELVAALAGDDPAGAVLIDLGGFDRDAQQLADAVRGSSAGSDAPIFFLGSGAEGIASTGDALGAGGDAFFALPVEAGKVVARLSTYLGVDVPRMPASLVLGGERGPAAAAIAAPPPLPPPSTSDDAFDEPTATVDAALLPALAGRSAMGAQPGDLRDDDDDDDDGGGEAKPEVTAEIDAGTLRELKQRIRGGASSLERAPLLEPPLEASAPDDELARRVQRLRQVAGGRRDEAASAEAGGGTSAITERIPFADLRATLERERALDDARPREAPAPSLADADPYPPLADDEPPPPPPPPPPVELEAAAAPSAWEPPLLVVDDDDGAQPSAAPDDERGSQAGPASAEAFRDAEEMFRAQLEDELRATAAPPPPPPLTPDDFPALERTDVDALRREERARLEEAKQELEHKLRLEAEARVERELEERVQRAVDEARRENDEARRALAAELAEASERERREAEARLGAELEERVRAVEARLKEEEQRLRAEMRREIEEEAKAEAEARARELELRQRREEAFLRGELEQKIAQAEARARREAEEEALRLAEELAAAQDHVRQRAEEAARAEAEARVRAAEAARAEAEERNSRELEELRIAAEAQRQELEARLRREADARIAEIEQRAAEAEARRQVDESERERLEQDRKRQADAFARTRAELEESLRREADARVQQELDRARQEAEEERRLVEERLRKEGAELAERAAEEARAEADERVRAEIRRAREAAARARAEAEQLSREVEERARREAEELARSVDERARREVEAALAREAEAARARAEAEEHSREVQERARREAEALAREADERARRAAEEARREAEERARREAEALAREADERARLAAEGARREAEERARREAEETLARERERERLLEERLRVAEEAARAAEERVRRVIEEERLAREEAEAALRQREEELQRQRRRWAFSGGGLLPAPGGGAESGLGVGRVSFFAADEGGRPVDAVSFPPGGELPVEPLPFEGRFCPMEPPAGELQDGELPALLFSAHVLGVSGALVVESGARQRALYLENGEPVGFSSDLAKDRPEEALLRAGLITAAKHVELRAGPLRSARRTCSLLVDEGALKPQELFTAIRGTLTEQVLALFEWGEGRYRYVAEHAHAADRVRLVHRFDALLAEGIRRKLDPPRLWRVLGGKETILGPDDKAQRLPPLTPAEQRALTLLDGQRSLEDVVLDAGVAAEDVLRAALIGISSGLARIVARGIPRSAVEKERDHERALAIDKERILDRLHAARHGDYFRFLGIAPEATGFEVRRAAADVRKQFDPQRYSDPAFRELFDALHEIRQVADEAEAVLSDDALRAGYVRNVVARRALEPSSRGQA